MIVDLMFEMPRGTWSFNYLNAREDEVSAWTRVDPHAKIQCKQTSPKLSNASARVSRDQSIDRRTHPYSTANRRGTGTNAVSFEYSIRLCLFMILLLL